MTSHSQSPAHWDQKYLTHNTPWDSGLVSRELISALERERMTPCRTVELGCGTGTNAVHLARQGFEVLALDCSAVAIELARQAAREADVSMQFAVAELCRLTELREALGAAAATFEHQCQFFFDRGCYHCARRVDLPGFLETVEWLAAPKAQMLMLCGNSNDPSEGGPPKLSREEIIADWSSLFEVVRMEEIHFEDRGGVPGPLGWACWMTRRPAA